MATARHLLTSGGSSFELVGMAHFAEYVFYKGVRKRVGDARSCGQRSSLVWQLCKDEPGTGNPLAGRGVGFRPREIVFAMLANARAGSRAFRSRVHPT